MSSKAHLLGYGRIAIGLLTVIVTVPALAQPVADDAKGTAAAHPRVRLATSVGDMVLELYEDKAPLSVANFLQYVRDGFYDGIAFHRVKADFMIQAGGYMADLKERTNGLRPPIKNESTNNLKNERGTVAMARVGDPHSATSQFFINVADNPHLDPSERQPFGYAVFGKVVEGMEVVDKIQRARTIKHPKDPRKGADGAVNPDPPITIREAVIEGQTTEAEIPAETLKPKKPAKRGARPGAKPPAETAPAEPTPTPAAEPEASPPAGEPEAAPQDPEGGAAEL